jgi:dTMP kinase
MAFNSKKGLFVTFEGGEGVGKSTQAQMLHKYLQDRAITSLLTREPGGSAFGEAFRKIILAHDIDDLTSLLAMMAARNQHIEELIKPSLKAGMVVICDRFVDSTACYQTNNTSIDINKVFKLHQDILGNFLPDLTIFLKLDPKLALPRAKNINAAAIDKIETKDINFHIKVYEKYLQLAQMFPERIKVVDASATLAEIYQQIINIVDQKLN